MAKTKSFIFSIGMINVMSEERMNEGFLIIP